MTVAYRKADKIKRDLKNQELWLQGMYFYEALLDVAPALAMIPKKPLPYRDEPFELVTGKQEEMPKSKEEQSDAKARIHFEMFAAAFNKKFEGKGDADG